MSKLIQTGETCTLFIIKQKMSFLKFPQHPDKFTIALFGKEPLLKKIESEILQGHSTFVKFPNDFELSENASFRIISTPDFFDEKHLIPDQKIIDFMALSYPGPHWFILAIDSENTSEDKVLDQIHKLKETFGKNVTKNLVIILEDQESLNLLTCLKEKHNIQMTTVDRNLASEFKEWSLKHQSFQFDYKNYSQDIVKRRKKELKSIRNEFHHQNDHQNTDGSAPSLSETVFSIILLGKSGTGKSASANTILAAGNSQHSILPNLVAGNSQQVPTQQFKSCPSSTPVTTKCEVKMMKIGAQVAVVDTPDFFYEEEHVQKAQLEECKKYCQEGKCVVLLVIQLGRFTEGESGILEKLEKHLGWKIREKTIVLFTHGEDMHCDVKEFISERSHLRYIVEACGNRYHVFKNTSKDSKQVKALVKRYPGMFPNFTAKQSSTQCSLC